MESYQRSQALVLLQDMVDRINANRKDAHDGKYDIVNNTANAEAVGAVNGAVGGGELDRDLRRQRRSVRLLRMGQPAERRRGAQWRQRGGSDDRRARMRQLRRRDRARRQQRQRAARHRDLHGHVAWQGLSETGAPASTLTCGRNAYGTEARRRVAASTLRIGALGAL